MRYILLFLIACMLPLAAYTQTKSINRFYREYKKTEEATKVTLPGIVIKLGVLIGKGQVDSDEEKEALKLANKIKKLRVLVLEDQNPVHEKDLNRLVKGLKSENFEELITVRSHDTKVNLLIREKKEKLKNILILVSEPDNFVMVSLKSKLKLEQIAELINKAIQGEVEEFDLDIADGEEGDRDSRLATREML